MTEWATVNDALLSASKNKAGTMEAALKDGKELGAVAAAAMICDEIRAQTLLLAHIHGVEGSALR